VMEKRASVSLRKLTVAVVGYGRIGKVHATNVARHPRCELAYLVGRSERGKDLAHQLGCQYVTWDQLVSSHDVDAVVLATPTPTHKELILQCVQKKWAVFVEKPVAFDPADIAECYAAAKAAGTVLFCGYQRRFDAGFRALRTAIEQGQVGDVQLVRLTSRDHPPPPVDFLATAGSFFQDFSTHDCDAARYLVGEEVVEDKVFATGSRFLASEGVDDTAVLVLPFPSGALAIIDNSRRATYGYDIRAEVLGSKGMLKLENPKASALPVIFADNTGFQSEPAPYSFPERFQEAYFAELDHFVDLVLKPEQTTSRVTQTDSAKTALLTILAEQSRLKQIPLNETKALSSYGNHYAEFKLHKEGSVGFCLFGVGRMGAVRARALRDISNAQLLYAIDIDQKSLEAFSKEFGCTPLLLEDADKALQDPRVDAVMISTTSASHFQHIMAALSANKAVFTEKPLALTVHDTKLCVEEAEKRKVPIYCGFQRRSDKHFRNLVAKLHSEENGKAELIRISSRDAPAHNSAQYLASSGGIFFDSLIHDFDIARWVIGEEPIEVYCVGTAFIPELRAAGDVDCVVCVLRFPSGQIVTIDNHRRAVYGYDQRLEVHTEHGMLAVDNVSQTNLTVASKKGFSLDTPTSNGMERYAEAYAAEVRHFVALLLHQETEPRVSLNDCLRGAIIAEAAKESLAAGGIRIPLHTRFA
jgi:myo-inositol 2-dehydrogenase/D-chiro-inositol 1-dehydrogenase